MDEYTLYQAVEALRNSKEWKDVRNRLGELNTDEAQQAMDSMDLLDELLERACH